MSGHVLIAPLAGETKRLNIDLDSKEKYKELFTTSDVKNLATNSFGYLCAWVNNVPKPASS